VCPGVSESRPNVRRNDTVSVITNGVQYDGYAHRVEMEKLKLKFDQSLCESVKTSPEQVKILYQLLPHDFMSSRTRCAACSEPRTN
jgi:GTPase SAR1 family protein